MTQKKGNTELTPRLAERTRLEYLEKMKSKKKEATFAPNISKKSKKICKQRQTVVRDHSGNQKVKPVLFSALHFDAEERAKRLY